MLASKDEIGALSKRQKFEQFSKKAFEQLL